MALEIGQLQIWARKASECEHAEQEVEVGREDFL